MLPAHHITQDGQHLRWPLCPHPCRCGSFLLLHQKLVSLSVSGYLCCGGFCRKDPCVTCRVGCSGHTANSCALAGEGEVNHCCPAGTQLLIFACRSGQLHNFLYFPLNLLFRNSKLRIEGELCSMVSTVVFTLRTNKYIQNFNRKLRELPDQKEGQWPTRDIPGDRKPSVSQLCL